MQKIAAKAKIDAEKLWREFQKNRINPDQDSVLERITRTVAEDFGKAPSSDDAVAWTRIALERIERQIPPGFSDDDKADGGVGDFLIWRELLEIGKVQKRPIVFVTGDIKPDWWEYYDIKGKGKCERIGPNTALASEMRQEAGVLYHQVDPEAFQRFSKDELDVPTTDETLEELRESIRDPYALRAVPFNAGVSAGWTFDRPYDFGAVSAAEMMRKQIGEDTAQALASLTSASAAMGALNHHDRINQMFPDSYAESFAEKMFGSSIPEQLFGPSAAEQAIESINQIGRKLRSGAGLDQGGDG